MGRLGEVLEAIYDAPRLEGALHARAYQVQDATRIRDVHDWWHRRRGNGPAGAAFGIRSTVGPPDRAETDHELWWSGPNRWRTQCDNRVFVFADGAFIMWAPEVGGTRQPLAEAPPTSWSGVLRPRWILDWFDLEVGPDEEIAGRRCWSVTLRPTEQEGQQPFRIGMPRWMGSDVTCTIDHETGVVLSYVARHEDAAVDSWTTTRFEPVPAIDASTFAFTTPDGSPLRDPEVAAHEAMLQHARDEGVDLTDVDVDDHRAVMDAVLRHRHGSSFGAVDPRLRAEQDAEQYVPTGPPPADAEAADAEIRRAFEGMLTRSDDGAAVPTVQGGSNLGPALVEAGDKANASASSASIRVDLVRFLGPDEAAVWYTVLQDGHHRFGPVTGRGRRIDGRWLVTRETFAHLVGSVGVRCPPPPSPPVH